MKLDNVKLGEMTFNHILRLIRELSIIGVSSYLAIRVFSGDLSLDFTKLSPSELVSILLAFFSISLAATFYFAATNASNQFYDNINKFNKDTSELLGRLDEQIKHVNTRQQELGDRIDKRYLSSADGDEESKSEENEEQIAEARAKWQESLDQILAMVEPEEKQRLEAELKKKDVELNVLREEQAKIEAKKMFQLRHYFRRKVEDFELSEAVTYSPDELLLKLIKQTNFSIRRDMVKHGFIETDRPSHPEEVTKKGQEFISSIVSRMLESKA